MNVESEDREFEDPTVIHLASADDDGFSSLAPGFQLLNSLEASNVTVTMSEIQ